MERVAWVGKLAPFSQPERQFVLRENALDDPERVRQWTAARRFWRAPVLVAGVLVAFYAFMFATGGLARLAPRRYSVDGLILIVAAAIVFGKPLTGSREPSEKHGLVDMLTPEDLVTFAAWMVMLGTMAFQVWLRLEGRI